MRSFRLKLKELYNDLKDEIANIKYAVIELEYREDENMINEIINGINARLDAIEAQLGVIENWKSIAQTKFGNLEDQIASINEIPANHEDRINNLESKGPFIQDNRTRIIALEDEVFEE